MLIQAETRKQVRSLEELSEAQPNLAVTVFSCQRRQGRNHIKAVIEAMPMEKIITEEIFMAKFSSQLFREMIEASGAVTRSVLGRHLTITWPHSLHPKA